MNALQTILKPFTAKDSRAVSAAPARQRANLVYYALLSLILIGGLLLRTIALGSVQDFNGDQGRDYIVVMNWLHDGKWPLLGPARQVGDYDLGPGWFYTIAPALALSRFHPAAGAATICALSLLAAFLMADWLRRATGSRAAALAVAAVFMFSTVWTEMGRKLWNPYALPFGVAALAWLIAVLPRRPLPCLAAALALMAIMPQWHTAGFVVDAAALVPLALAVRSAWPAIRSTTRRSRIVWGAALFAAIALLYVPPVVYEFSRAGKPSNLKTFFSKTGVLAKPWPGSIPWRGVQAFDKLFRRGILAQDFNFNPAVGTPAAFTGRLLAGGAIALAFALLYAGQLRRRRIDPTVTYLALLAAAFWLVLLLKGDGAQDYCLIPAWPALLMLAAWTGGSLIECGMRNAECGIKYTENSQSSLSNQRSNIPHSAFRIPHFLGIPHSAFRIPHFFGWLILVAAVGLSLAQLPTAWSVHRGVRWPRFLLRDERAAVDFIVKDSAGKPFSLEQADPGNFPAHFFYLLRRAGRPPLNVDRLYVHRISRKLMGERIYIIAGVSLAKTPQLAGWSGPLAAPIQVGGLKIYRIDPGALPKKGTTLKVVSTPPLQRKDPTPWTLQLE